jgi:hypothetical protein
MCWSSFRHRASGTLCDPKFNYRIAPSVLPIGCHLGTLHALVDELLFHDAFHWIAVLIDRFFPAAGFHVRDRSLPRL